MKKKKYEKIKLDMHIQTEIELGRPMIWERTKSGGENGKKGHIGFRYIEPKTK